MAGNLAAMLRDFFVTEYDRAKVPQLCTMEMIPALPGSLKALLFPPLLNEMQNNRTQGVRARYDDAELRPFISIVRHPGRPVMLGADFFQTSEIKVQKYWGKLRSILVGKFVSQENHSCQLRSADVPPYQSIFREKIRASI